MPATIDRFSARVRPIAIAVFRRIPELALIGLYGIVARDGAGQIAALFSTLRFPRDPLILLLIASLTGGALAALTEARGPRDRRLSAGLLTLPVAILAIRLAGEGTGWLALGTIATAMTFLLSLALLSTESPSWGRIGLVAGIAVVVWLGLHVAMRLSPIALPRALGSLAIGLAFFGLVAIVLKIVAVRPWIGLPAMIPILTVFFLNEQSHRLRLKSLPTGSEATESINTDRAWTNLHQVFTEWLLTRNDLQAYRSRGKPYPVFVVTSQGGGGYAAAHAYLFLSKMQRRCPNFAQHVFAIIGVSGGAVGNTLFWRSLPAELNHDRFLGCEGEAVAAKDVALLSVDHLSPALAAMLFQDFPNKLLLGMLGERDRTGALIASLTEDVPLGDPRNPFYWEHYWGPPSPDGQRMSERPAVIQVATNAVSGKRYVFAPFRFRHPTGRFEEATDDLHWTGSDEVGARATDVGLFDAAVASASFPYITPSLLLEGRHGQLVSLVDGGYLDNSGAETLREFQFQMAVINPFHDGLDHVTILPPESYRPDAALEASIANCPDLDLTQNWSEYSYPEESCDVMFRLLPITIRSEPPRKRFADGQNFFLDPVRALEAVRARRAETARMGLLCGGGDCPEDLSEIDIDFYESVVVENLLGLPTGWYIPSATIAEMERVVAPEPDADLDDSLTLLPTSIPDSELWQANIFAEMMDNPGSVAEITSARDPNSSWGGR